jgi:hypothetical protein
MALEVSGNLIFLPGFQINLIEHRLTSVIRLEFTKGFMNILFLIFPDILPF